MSTVSAASFDRLAARYDEQWTHAAAGRLQRQAVWSILEPVIHPGDSILDLGCGTGEDALRLMRLGVHVSAIDASPEMVRIARAKGVNARVMRIEETASLQGTYDVVLSNFGALNCVEDLGSLRDPLTRLVRPGGVLAICLLSRFCLWELLHYAARGRIKKATRRWSGESRARIGMRVFYPSVRRVCDAFAPGFFLQASAGIGITLPPSYVPELPLRLLGMLGSIDRWLGPTALGRSVSDHRLMVFVRS